MGWLLAFDAGCSSCTSVTQRLNDEIGHVLITRNISDPDIVELRKQAFGANPPWAPTLLETKGDRVRGWCGPRLSLRLTRLVGPRRAQRITRQIAHDSMPTDAQRRNVLKLLPAAAGSGLFLLSGGTAGAQTTTGANVSSSAGDKAIDIAHRSPVFNQQLQKYPDVQYDWQNARAEANDDKAWVALLGATESPVRRAVVGRAAVDTTQNTVPFIQTVELESTEPLGFARIAVNNVDTPAYRGRVNSDGSLTPDPGYQQTQANLFSSPGNPGALSVCSWAVGALCGTGGATGCYFVCAGLGLVSGPGGIGCAAACGLVSSLGCTGATEVICG